MTPRKFQSGETDRSGRISKYVTLTNSAAYLAGWIKAIKGDPKLVIVAAAAAQKAADYILNRQAATAQESACALAA